MALLADGLVDRGHDVTLFATGDAKTKAKVVSVFDQPQPDKIGKLVPEIYHVGSAYQQIRSEGFDIIHDHTFSAPVMGSSINTPVLATIHGEINDLTAGFYQKFGQAVYYNAISEHQCQRLPGLRYVDTVHNTIDFGAVEVQPRKKGFLLSLGRIGPEKGAHVAIEVAKRLGRRLILAGKVDPGKDERYFQTEIEPQIDGRLIKFVGEVGEDEKRRLMSEASCFLFPIQWSEPFGLVMLEAMAVGTPVVAFDRGAVREIIKPGVSGFIVRDIDDMVAQVGLVDKLDPFKCRAYAEAAFPGSAMVERYEDNYWRILRNEEQTERSLTVL